MSSPDNQQVSRGLLITLGVVVLLGGLYAVWVFVAQPLLSGDGDDVAEVPPTGTPSVVPSDELDGDLGAPPGPEGTEAEDQLAEDPLADQVVPETFEIFTARDPFQQLVVEAEAATGTGTTGTGTTGTGTTGGGTTGGGTTGGTTGGGATGDDTADANGGTGDGATAPASANVGTTTIRLDDVFVGESGDPQLRITVNGTSHLAGEGEVFADRFRVLDIDGVCATFLFGDSRFTLCEGESIVK